MNKIIVLPVVLYGCETWSLALREEHILGVFENRVLRRIFGPKRVEGTGEWRKLHNEEIRDKYSSPSIVRINKARKMRWAGLVARMGEKRYAYRLLVGKPEGRRPLGRPRRRWLNNIRMDLVEVGCGDVDWIGLAQDRDRWRALVISVLNMRALSKIGLLVQSQCLIHLESTETTMNAWNALQSAYEDKGVNRLCILLGKVIDVKLKNFNNMENYVTRVLKTAQEIASTGKALDDYLIATLLLRGLTPEYKPMSLALEKSGVEFSTDYIKTKLLQEGYNPNPKAPYSSENVLVSHYKCRKSSEYNSEQKPKYVRNQCRTNQGCFISQLEVTGCYAVRIGDPHYINWIVSTLPRFVNSSVRVQKFV
jgi:hypothetical protein